MGNELTTPIQNEAAASVMGLLKKYGGNIRKTLPKHLTGDRCAMLVMNSIAANPALANCTPVSFLNSVLLASNLGLEIRKNSCYLIPFGKECQLVIDYRGKMELARRAGAGAIQTELVHEGDEFEYGYDGPKLIFHWRHSFKDRGEIIGGFCAAEIHGGTQVTVMTLEDVERIRRRSQNGRAIDGTHYGKPFKGLTLAEIRKLDPATMKFNDPYRVPWVTDWDRMARKTIIHRAANDWPQSPELLTAQEIDTAVDIGAPLPVAEELAEVVLQLDPADNRPMVEAGDRTLAAIKALCSTSKGAAALKAQGISDPDEITPEDRATVLAVLEKAVQRA